MEERKKVMREKRLTKSADKKVCGVCGGFAEYFGIDPTIIRLIYVILILCSGIGILPYIIAAIVMDEAPEVEAANRGYVEDKYPTPVKFEEAPEAESDEPVGFKLNSDNN